MRHEDVCVQAGKERVSYRVRAERAMRAASTKGAPPLVRHSEDSEGTRE